MKIKVGKLNSPYAARRKAAFAAATRSAGREIGALLVGGVEDVGYLSGFTGDDSFLLVEVGGATLLTDGRYGEQAAWECPGVEIHVRKGPMAAAIVELVKARKIRSLALQAEHLTLRWKDAIAKALPSLKLLHVSDVPGLGRQVKDPDEIAAIRRAVKIAQEGFLALMARGRSAFIGRTERQVAAELDYRMRLAGADKSAFDTIVAVGPHGSLPHYRPGDTVIREGQMVLVDWGALASGYCSDLTRVVLTGTIPPKLGEVYEVVRRAQISGMAAVRAGAAAKTVDSAARSVIDKAGYKLQFVHGLGHGIGRQIHEMPSMNHTSSARLKRGMVITVEPGIYLPGVGGVRIEDDVLVGPKGPVKLSSLPTGMAAMTLR